jgi:exonuclease VII large subunit
VQPARDEGVDEGAETLLSPLASLERGYAIVRGEGGAVIRDARDVPEGARVEVIVRAGRFHARREGDPEPEAR